MERYTDYEAAELLNWKIGTVRFLKRQMRQHGLLQVNESMTRDSIQLARQISNYQHQQGSSFADATRAILMSAPKHDLSLEETLRRVKAGELAETALLIPIAERLLALEKRK